MTKNTGAKISFIRVLYFSSYRFYTPGSSDGKESACSTEHLGLIPGSEDPLEKRKTTHSSIIAWRIPWTEESSRLQSKGLQRGGHD